MDRVVNERVALIVEESNDKSKLLRAKDEVIAAKEQSIENLMEEGRR